jgi:SAM-dependent methyltransferase
MIEEIDFNNKKYPIYESQGFSAKFAFPFAKEVCKGFGYDIGCMKKEWAFPGAKPIDLSFGDKYDAFNLPDKQADYIFSSHCLEHIDNWVDALEYWIDKLEKKGTLFLYLPNYSQEYWRPWNNKKHKHIFTPEIIVDYLNSNRKVHKIYSSETDLNDSFSVMCERIEWN